MMDYCVRESTINKDNIAVQCGREKSIAAYTNKTTQALNEADLTLDHLFDTMFGQLPEQEVAQVNGPIGSLERAIEINAEHTAVIASRIRELTSRILGE